MRILHRGLLAVILLAAIPLAAVPLVALSTTGGADRAARPFVLDITGCGHARAQRLTVPSSGRVPTELLDVTVDACPDVADPTDRVARIAWRSLPADIDEIRVRTGGNDSPTTLLTRTDLRRRYGDNDMHDPDSGDLLWLLLPLTPVVVVTAACAAIRRARRAGVAVIIVPRR